MNELSPALVRLNLETRQHHAAADRPWRELVDGDRAPTEQEYMRRLVRTYGFEAPLEAALAYTPSFDRLVDMSTRYRSGLIAQDLLALGLSAAQVAAIPQCMLAPFSGVTEALGWLYVHERAMLAHEHVRAALALRAPRLLEASSYLSAHTGGIGARFDELGRLLERYGRTAQLEERTISAAHTAFRTLDRWNEETLNTRTAIAR